MNLHSFLWLFLNSAFLHRRSGVGISFFQMFSLAIADLDSPCWVLFAVFVFVCDDVMSLLVCTLFSHGFHLVRRVILFGCEQRTWVAVCAVILHKNQPRREPIGAAAKAPSAMEAVDTVVHLGSQHCGRSARGRSS